LHLNWTKKGTIAVVSEGRRLRANRAKFDPLWQANLLPIPPREDRT
jgi:hypothetical protein